MRAEPKTPPHTFREIFLHLPHRSCVKRNRPLIVHTLKFVAVSVSNCKDDLRLITSAVTANQSVRLCKFQGRDLVGPLQCLSKTFPPTKGLKYFRALDACLFDERMSGLIHDTHMIPVVQHDNDYFSYPRLLNYLRNNRSYSLLSLQVERRGNFYLTPEDRLVPIPFHDLTINFLQKRLQPRTWCKRPDRCFVWIGYQQVSKRNRSLNNKFISGNQPSFIQQGKNLISACRGLSLCLNPNHQAGHMGSLSNFEIRRTPSVPSERRSFHSQGRPAKGHLRQVLLQECCSGNGPFEMHNDRSFAQCCHTRSGRSVDQSHKALRDCR